ncbi:hypothetical protein HYQ44_006671 [Verticillium longisporum]|nr:hypothetical protein HYQ44_006671 [Verticillium longisporum]
MRTVRTLRSKVHTFLRLSLIHPSLCISQLQSCSVMDDEARAKFMAELDAMIREATDKDSIISKLTGDIATLKSLSQQGSSSRKKRGKVAAQDVDAQITEIEEEASRLRESSRALWLKINDMQEQQRGH